MPDAQIRAAVDADLPTIVEIYNASIPSRRATADLEPVSAASRRDWFDKHSSTRPLWVMEWGAVGQSLAPQKAIAGWLSFNSFYGRPAYHHTAELSIYVSPDSHRQGIGRSLLHHAIEQSPQLGLHTLIAMIFAHNQPSLQLFKKFEFQQWGYLPKIAELDGVERDLAILGRRL